MARLTTQQFIENARKIHGDKYDYGLVNYARSHGKVLIKCPVHGLFLQAAYSHTDGRGCSGCSGLRKHTTRSFTERAKETHGDRYDYSLTKYAGNKRKITIICGQHGRFEQTPNSHLLGRGCPQCAKGAYNNFKPGFVYFLLSSCGEYLKVGLSNKPRQRVSELRTRTPFNFTVIDVYSMTGKLAQIVEKHIHGRMESANLKDFSGCTEWFKHDYDKEYEAHCICTQVGKLNG